MTNSTRRIYRANGVEIDPDAGRIRRMDGDEVFLRRKSNLLLACLIERRNAPVTKDELVQSVWAGAAVTDDTLVNCIQEIRKALGDEARSPTFIRTVPKTGYWFVASIEEGPATEPVTESPPKIPSPTRSSRPWRRGAAAALLIAGVAGYAVWK